MTRRKSGSTAPETPKAPETVLKAVEAQLARDGHLQPAIAASARALARAVDGADSPSQLATAARELRMTMAALAGMDSERAQPTGPAPAVDPVDELKRKREANGVPAAPTRRRRTARA